MTDRERFEAWVLEEDSEQAIEKDERGNYRWLDTRHAWRAWQASRKQALEEALHCCELADEQAQSFDEGYGASQCENAIRALANPEGEQG